MVRPPQQGPFRDLLDMKTEKRLAGWKERRSRYGDINMHKYYQLGQAFTPFRALATMVSSLFFWEGFRSPLVRPVTKVNSFPFCGLDESVPATQMLHNQPSQTQRLALPGICASHSLFCREIAHSASVYCELPGQEGAGNREQ